MESQAAAVAAAEAAAAEAEAAASAAASAAAEAAAAAAASGGGDFDHSRMQELLANVVAGETNEIRLAIDSIADRVASLEEVSQLSMEGLTAEQIASIVHEAKEATQSQLNEEMVALDERVDKRAREEAKRVKEEIEAERARNSMRRVSSTISSYNADLAVRLEGLRLDHEKQGTEVARASEEIAVADASLKELGSELYGLGEVANKVNTICILYDFQREIHEERWT